MAQLFFTLHQMPELVTLRHVADLRAALENAYPFAEHPDGRSIWIDSLRRHALEFPITKTLKETSAGPMSLL
jgi:hypothetical protein